MQNCHGCNKETGNWFGDAWCDNCGGVVVPSGVLIFRHIATVTSKDGSSVRVCHDISASFYLFRCNRINPRYLEFVKRGGTISKEQQQFMDFIPTPVLTKWNDDLKITLKEAKNELDDRDASVVFAPTATPEERNA